MTAGNAIETVPYYIKDQATGRIRFTPTGLDELRPLFARASVNIHAIQTETDYLEARRKAAPFFQDHLVAIASNGPKTMERRLLIAIAQGDREEADRLEKALDQRNALGLKTV